MCPKPGRPRDAPQGGREAQVSEPISIATSRRSGIYLACVDDDWARLRVAIEAEVSEEPDPAEWPLAIARSVRRLHEQRSLLPHIWIRALSEAGADPTRAPRRALVGR